MTRLVPFGHAALSTAPTGTSTTLQRIHDACERIALGELGLDVYPNQIEVITAEQMLDAYSSIGMPLFYKHWSFGKHFAQHEAFYRKGLHGSCLRDRDQLASPCISYLMEENTATMQTLVDRACGLRPQPLLQEQLSVQAVDRRGRHSRLSRFRQGLHRQLRGAPWPGRVERTLDAAHALMSHGVHRYPGKKQLDLGQEEQRERERRAHEERIFNDLWRTVPAGPQERGELGRASGGRCSGCRRTTSCIFSRSPRRACSPGSASSSHRPPRRAVFLSPGADQGDERGHRRPTCTIAS